MLLHLFPQFFVSGITNGSIYSLIALGYCLIQNATGLVNFVQGDFLMIGALLTITLYQVAGLPMPLAIAAAIAATAAVGMALERGPIRHSRNRDLLSLVIITIGASIAFRGSAMLVWGKNAHTLPPLGGDHPILFLHAAIMPQSLWILALSLAILGLLYLFFHFTLVGKAMRAAADNPFGAVLVGISVRRIVALAFALSGALGAIGGILIAPITSMSYDTGVMLGLKGFAAAVLGGYGSVPGAVVGGLLLGVLEALGAGYISSASKDAIAFVILLFILFVKPSGLFGNLSVRRL